MKKKLSIAISIAIILALAVSASITYHQLSDSFKNVIMEDGTLCDGLFDVIKLFSDFNNENYEPYNEALLDRGINALNSKSNKYTTAIRISTKLNDGSFHINITMNVNNDIADGSMLISFNNDNKEDQYKYDFTSSLKDGKIEIELVDENEEKKIITVDTVYENNVAIDALSLLESLKEEKTDWFPSMHIEQFAIGYAQLFGEASINSTLVVFHPETHELTEFVRVIHVPDELIDLLQSLDNEKIKSVADKLAEENKDASIVVRYSNWGE